ncbi:MAG: succinyl-diaminopimelate desuccinylase [Propionivibrio sp.]|uniref:succinyl-diaminopimelate desuccinylase n=1 Tax=Propionivibrio sp. TaxID=2212460 RepID=UPI0025E5640E|nr:succinyl-diaminopimelate desuccinylase [Propionivibrio sp.]MBK8400253.1 succinyl-diaminopimelate desuccinylase [Propionivibrio sp.]MBK8893044.1 succinyl-diaminopimelate desuccinylase [Propionivibrio sp.]MBL0207274.1 succinyl-diaminopimelate desuccinylase [Propionivibrio sp.]
MPGDATLDLSEQLIACCSITPDDGGCMPIIEARLKRMGFTCEYINRCGVTNLWARRGSGRPLLCLAGHTDVVPTGPRDQWQSDPFQPTRRDGLLYGRGAADMKGSLAAFVTASEDFIAAHPDHAGSMAFLLTSDEEGDAVDGTVAVIEALAARGEAMDFCIIGEPTSLTQLGDTIKNGRRGSLSGKLMVKGVQGHIAYPHLAKNPIHLAAPAIAELASRVWDQGNEFFPPTTWQISNIHAGTGANNVIPGSLEIQFNFRFATASTPNQLQMQTVEILDRHGLEYELAWTLGAKPFLTGRGTLVEASLRSIREITGVEAELSTTGGTSDGRFIADLCPQVIEIGPINASIHKIDECVEIASLAKLSAIYRRILEQLLS